MDTWGVLSFVPSNFKSLVELDLSDNGLEAVPAFLRFEHLKVGRLVAIIKNQ